MMASLEEHERREELHTQALDRWNLHGVEQAMVPTDLSQLLRDGVPPAKMLLDDWLYAGELHWIYAEAEAWKTWVTLILAYRVMQDGQRVAWFDEELGEAFLVRRLEALGADADVIEKYFAYFPFPNMQLGREVRHADGTVQIIGASDLASHRDTLRAIKPALVVYDTATDMLTAAGLDENSGKEVTSWVKAFPEEARKLGITQIVCDHTAKGGETAVGSRAKRAKAKVQYYFKSEERGDESTVGKLRVTLTKNTPGNVLPQERIFSIGGNGEGGFVFDLLETRAGTSPDDRKAGKREAVRRLIEQTLEEHRELNQSQLTGMIDGSRTITIEVVKEMAAEPHISGVESFPDGRSLKYRWVGKTPLPT
jgi:AAA domain